MKHKFDNKAKTVYPDFITGSYPDDEIPERSPENYRSANLSKQKIDVLFEPAQGVNNENSST